MENHLAGKTILIVDDEPDLREIVAAEFQRVGCNILEASGGREAFDLILGHPVDAVVSDLHMPKGDGIELLGWLRAYNPSAPAVVLMSGFGDIDEKEAIERGAEGIFNKPFDRKQMVATVARALMPSTQKWLRKNPRKEIHVPVKVKVIRTGRMLQGEILNVSIGGMFVHLKAQIPERNELLNFSFALEGSEQKLEGMAIVAWVRPDTTPVFASGFGMEFLAISDTTRDAVDRLLGLLAKEEEEKKR